MNDAPAPHLSFFSRRVLVTTGIVAIVALAFLLVWQLSQVLLLLFASVMLAIFLRGISDFISRKTGISAGWSLLITVLVLLALAITAISYFSMQLAQQVDELITQLSQAADSVQAYLNDYEWGRQILDAAGIGGGESGQDSAAGTGSQGVEAPTEMVQQAYSQAQDNVVNAATRLFSTLFGAVSGFVIFLFLGLYLAVNPEWYKRGIVKLVPIPHRHRAREVIEEVAHTLRGWLFAQMISMSIIGLLSMLGLWLLGIQLWFILGLLAALLTFIPNIGPVLSVIPPALLALNQGPMLALYVVLYYIALQTVESYFITPMIQQHAIDLPPVVIITTQVAMSILFGVLGLAMAMPLAAATMVLIQMLYIQDILGDQNVQIAGAAD